MPSPTPALLAQLQRDRPSMAKPKKKIRSKPLFFKDVDLSKAEVIHLTNKKFKKFKRKKLLTERLRETLLMTNLTENLTTPQAKQEKHQWEEQNAYDQHYGNVACGDEYYEGNEYSAYAYEDQSHQNEGYAKKPYRDEYYAGEAYSRGDRPHGNGNYENGYEYYPGEACGDAESRNQQCGNGSYENEAYGYEYYSGEAYGDAESRDQQCGNGNYENEAYEDEYYTHPTKAYYEDKAIVHVDPAHREQHIDPAVMCIVDEQHDTPKQHNHFDTATATSVLKNILKIQHAPPTKECFHPDGQKHNQSDGYAMPKPSQHFGMTTADSFLKDLLKIQHEATPTNQLAHPEIHNGQPGPDAIRKTPQQFDGTAADSMLKDLLKIPQTPPVDHSKLPIEHIPSSGQVTLPMGHAALPSEQLTLPVLHQVLSTEQHTISTNHEHKPCPQEPLMFPMEQAPVSKQPSSQAEQIQLQRDSAPFDFTAANCALSSIVKQMQ